MNEKLNLWDRIFNRYKKVIIEEGKETWNKYYTNYYGESVIDYSYDKFFVKYKIIDRITGSEEIEKEYLN